jgi:CHAT domain-containing protein/tetratricopeptide (TPR) repeat protein
MKLKLSNLFKFVSILMYILKKTYRFFSKYLTIAFLITFTLIIFVFHPWVQAQSTDPVADYFNQGNEYYQRGDRKSAIETWQRALNIAQEKKDLLNQSVIRSNLSLAYQDLEDWAAADRQIQASIKLIQQIKAPDVALAQIFNVAGKLELALGQPQRALDQWQQAAHAYEKAKRPIEQQRVQINQALALQALGFYRKSCNLFLITANLTEGDCTNELTLKRIEKVSNRNLISLRHLGEVLRVLGRFSESGLVLGRASKISNPAEQSAIQLAIAKTLDAQITQKLRAQTRNEKQALLDCQRTPLLDLGTGLETELKTAIDRYQVIIREAPDGMTKLQAQIQLLSLQTQFQPTQIGDVKPLIEQVIQQKASSQAIDISLHLVENLICLGTPNSHSQEIKTLFHWAQQREQELNQGRGDRPYNYRLYSYLLGYQAAFLEKIELDSNKPSSDLEIWGQIESLTKQALKNAENAKAPEIKYLWEWQLGRIAVKMHRQNSIAIQYYSLAFETLKKLRQDLAAIGIDGQFSFRDRVEPVYRQYVNLLLQPVDSPEKSQEQLKKAHEVIEDLQVAELENFFRESCLPDLQRAEKTQVEKIIDSNTTIIYPILLSDRIELITINHSTQPNQTRPFHHEIGNSAEIRAYLDLEPSRKFVPENLNKLHSALIQPIENHIQKKTTLIFVLDAEMQNIPINAIYNSKTNKYLVEDYAIAIVPSLKFINRSQPVAQLSWQPLLAGAEKFADSLFSLPKAQQEIQHLQQKFKLPSERVLLNDKFTESNFQTHLQQLPVNLIHLATHAKFSSNLDETYIYTQDGKITINRLREIIQEREFANQMPIQLLTLSACETASGDRRATLGLAGVASRAGVQTVLATHLLVDDPFTEKFMIQFYEVLTEGTNSGKAMTKVEALQMVQKRFIQDRSSNYHRPQYWASYVLIGNWL